MMLLISVLFNIILLVLLGIVAKAAVDKMNEYDEIVLEMRRRISFVLDYIKSIDYRGSFEADDEVGAIYSDIKEAVNKLDGLIVDEEG